jgi:hypothetical protein
MANVQYDVAVRAAGLSHTDNMKNEFLDWSQLADVKNATYEVHPTTWIEKNSICDQSLPCTLCTAAERSAEQIYTM